ncbi:MAG: T9SS type A sorting domain-containing protein [Crocinitomicaceae bacterium]|nr:T9SS type A sorting domain-containing protein [Crocinitomicaceae bacterium]
MKKFFTLLAIACAPLAMAQSTYAVGATVNDFTVTDTKGNSHNLYTITASGKYVFLDFFFDTCPPCISTSPVFNEFYDKYGCNTGDVYCLAINNGTDNNAEVDAFKSTHGGSTNHAPAVSNEGGCAAVDTDFGVSAYPTYVLIGPDNKVIANDIWPISTVANLEAVFPSGFSPSPMACSFASVEEEEALSALSVFPNPAVNTFAISYSAETAGTVSINILNMVGQTVLTTTTSSVTGTNNVNFDATELEAGQYIAQVTLNDKIENIKFQVTK